MAISEYVRKAQLGNCQPTIRSAVAVIDILFVLLLRLHDVVHELAFAAMLNTRRTS